MDGERKRGEETERRVSDSAGVPRDEGPMRSCEPPVQLPRMAAIFAAPEAAIHAMRALRH